ncbi:hypothetical protein BGX33_004511 [Mortierella sp. NVP41]|nr:hypothetical protein BGX33_004511 [Mortierella sp. NVP41]
MDQNLGNNPLIFQDCYQHRDENGLLEDEGTADEGGLFGEEITIASERFIYHNLSKDAASSAYPFTSIPQISGDMCLLQQQQQQQQQQSGQYQQAHQTDSSMFPFPIKQQAFVHLQQEQMQRLQELGVDVTSAMEQFSNLQHVLKSQLQESTTLSVHEFLASSMLDPFQQQLALTTPALDSSSVLSGIAVLHQQEQQQAQHFQSLLQQQQQYASPLEGNIFHHTSLDFTDFRSLTLDHTSSPDDGSLSPNPTSERGYFDVPADEFSSSSASPFLPSQGIMIGDYLMGSMMDFTLSPAGTVPSSFSSAATVTPHNITAPVVPSMSSSSLSSTSSPREIRMPSSAIGRAAGAARKNNPQQQAAAGSGGGSLYPTSLSCSASSYSSSYGSSVPASSSPLKQQFNGFSTDDDSDLLNEEEEQKANTKRRKRVRKAVPKTVVKPKGPSITLYCQFPGCQVTCSSQPSMVRHAEGHKWRGQYSPVRCEACNASLSNEFSVQRHITRSNPRSRCHQMRVYSIMKSPTEIETTVRFFPRRPHGKKTIKVDLEKKRAKYFGVGNQ